MDKNMKFKECVYVYEIYKCIYMYIYIWIDWIDCNFDFIVSGY